MYYNSASQSQSPSEVVNEIRNKCYSILIQSFVSYTSVLGGATSEPSGRGYSGQSTEAPRARPPPRLPGMQAGRPHMVTPRASSSGQSRHRTWLGRTPRRHKQEWPHQGSHLSPAQREPLRAVQQPCCPRAILSHWQPSSPLRPAALARPCRPRQETGRPSMDLALPQCTNSFTSNATDTG